MANYQRATEVLGEHVELSGRRVVDVGSGDGGLVRWLRRQGADPTGIECGSDILRQAREADPDHAGAYLDGVGQDLPFEDFSIDVVVLFRSLHHIPVEQMGTAMAEAHRVLDQGGVLFVLEPTYDERGRELQSLIDDETVVRAHAQAALAEVPSLGFELLNFGDFVQEFIYRDFAQWEQHMVDVDPQRLAALDLNRAKAERLFHHVGIPTEDGGFRFDFPNMFQAFRKL